MVTQSYHHAAKEKAPAWGEKGTSTGSQIEEKKLLPADHKGHDGTRSERLVYEVKDDA